MVVSQNEGDPIPIPVNENGDSSGLIDDGAHKMGHDPMPIIDLNLNPDMINEYGQLIGEYSKLDDELCLPKCEDDDHDALEFSYEFDATFHEKMVDLNRPSALNLEPLSEHVDRFVPDGAMVPVNVNTSSLPSALNLEPLSEHVDHSVPDGAMVPVNENTSFLEDSSENQSQIPSPVSVLKRKRSYSNATATLPSQVKYCQPPTKDSVSGGLQFPGTTISNREESQAVQSESEYSMESFLSDEIEESVPLQVVRTRKISDLLDLNHPNRAVKKCLHCESTETPQWRNGPMGRKTLCNACGVQYKHGRLFDDYRPLRSPTFDPSKHFSLPKKVQELRMGHTSERGPCVASRTKKVKGMSKGNNARDCDPDFTLKPKKFKEMRMGNRCGRYSNPILKPKKVQELRMGNTCERDSNPTLKPNNAEEMRMSISHDVGQNLVAEPRRVEESRMGNNSNLGKNLTPEPERVEGRSWGNNNERDQEHARNMVQNLTCKPERVEEMSWGNNNERDHQRAQRAKKFHNLGEKDSNWLDSYSWERDRNFESGLQQNRKMVKACTHCASTETPQWREGPSGRKTLCNACGVQYRHGRLFPEYRPLKSPTYDPVLHSHLPKKVMEMRMRLAEKCAAPSNCEDLA